MKKLIIIGLLLTGEMLGYKGFFKKSTRKPTLSTEHTPTKSNVELLVERINAMKNSPHLMPVKAQRILNNHPSQHVKQAMADYYDSMLKRPGMGNSSIHQTNQ